MHEESTSIDLLYADKTIMFADVADYVRLMQGDERRVAADSLALLLGAASEIVPRFRGTLIERPGDALLVAFDDPRDAVGCALALHQRATALPSEPAARDAPSLRFHIGIHSAAVMTDGIKFYGHGVNTAARLTGVAGPAETVISEDVRAALARLAGGAQSGETLVSGSVRDQLTQQLDGDFEDLGFLSHRAEVDTSGLGMRIEALGEINLKNIEGPVRAYRVGGLGPQPVIEPGTATLHELRASVVVLPFTRYATDEARIGLGDVLTDQLTNALSQAPNLRVISRLSAQAFRRRAADVNEIGRLLGAAFVVSGRYRTEGEVVQVTLEVANARSGAVEWGGAIVGRAADALSIGSDLIQELASRVLNAVVQSEVHAARGLALPNLSSHTLYLAATLLMHRFAQSDFKIAHDMLVALSERAPRHPNPWAWLARWHVFRVVQGWSEDVDRDRREALGYAQRALDLEPESSLALTIAGSVHTNLLKDVDGAIELYTKAIEINASEPLAWALFGMARNFQGRGEEAQALCERAITLSPLDPLRYFYDNLAAAAALTTGDYVTALKCAHAAVRANRMHTSNLRTLAIAQSLLGQNEAASATLREVLRRDPQLTAERYFARLPFGDPVVARRLVNALIDAGLPRGGLALDP